MAVLKYQETGTSNKPLKYFLMCIEYYYQWYKDGANSRPLCLDKSRVYDFAGTSIEHIYPRNPTNTDKDHNIEPLKNSLGNLTIMDTVENVRGDNDPFLTKKHLYQRSSVVLTQEIGTKTDSTLTEIEIHQQSLIDAAIAIFHP
ncbi:MAG: HNH endonuclease [Dolichospermum sp. BR01]|nr:HNH endonuclease [Dolichospermum sp. BR01]